MTAMLAEHQRFADGLADRAGALVRVERRSLQGAECGLSWTMMWADVLRFRRGMCFMRRLSRVGFG